MEINNYKIDPLDKEYLDECVNSFRLDLLHEAYMLSKKRDEEGISQKSIDEALANILRNNNVSSKRLYFKGRRLVYLGVLTGLLYTVCGSVIFFVQNTNFRPDKDLGQFVMIWDWQYLHVLLFLESSLIKVGTCLLQRILIS